MMRELLRDYVLILANTGIRHGTEAINLNWRHIEWFINRLYSVSGSWTEEVDCLRDDFDSSLTQEGIVTRGSSITSWAFLNLAEKLGNVPKACSVSKTP